MKLKVMNFGDQKSFELGGMIRMHLGNIIEVSKVSQNAQKRSTTLKMALADRKRTKIKVPKIQLKLHDREERVARFPMTQTTRQTELWIKSYKRSKFWSTQPNQRG
jgi:hypothetical protein